MNREWVFRLCMMFICIGITSCTAPRNISKYGVTEKNLTQAIENISFQRELAELYVTMSLANSKDNPYVQEKYGRAAAQANSFIDKLKFSFTIRKIDSEDMTKDVEQVVVAVNDLHAAVRSLIEMSSDGRGKTASAIPQLITPVSVDSIVNSAITVWKASQEREDKYIDEIKKELDRQRWKGWKDLIKVI